MAVGALVDMVTGERLPFQYDPPEMEGGDSVTWADQQVPGTSHKGAHFVAGDERSTHLVLQFTAEEPGYADVRRKVDWIRATTFPEYRDQDLADGPHPVLVSYGPFFEGKTYRVLKVGWKLLARDPATPDFRAAEVTVDLAEIGESTSFDEVRW